MGSFNFGTLVAGCIMGYGLDTRNSTSLNGIFLVCSEDCCFDLLIWRSLWDIGCKLK